MAIAAARDLPVGQVVHLAGVVTAGQGLLGDDALFAMADDSAGIFVRITTTETWLEPGRQVEVVGTLAAPYGQLEVRSLTRLSQGPLADAPGPTRVDLDGVGESTEGSLVTVNGSITAVANDGSHLSLTIGDGTSSTRVFAAPLTGLSREDVSVGNVVVATGIVGQRATATGRLDGYRIWLRAAEDLATREPFEPDPSGGEETPAPRTASPTATSAPAHDLASALGTKGMSVDVRATVTATAGLFEIDGPTIVVDDGTASVAVILPLGAAAPPVGAEIRLLGKVGRWETGPTVRATAIQVLGQAAPLQPAQLTAPPTAALEWHLVRAYGRIDKVTRAGARWRIEMLVNGQRVVILGEPPAGPLPDETKDRMATMTGIVRRSTSDSASFQLLPRGSGDIRFGPSLVSRSAVSTSGSSGARTAGAAANPASIRVPLSEIGSHVGSLVTVAGLVTSVGSGEAVIEDGTGQVRIGGTGAVDEIDLLELGDAVEVTGTVSQDAAGFLVLADPASVVVMPGQLGEIGSAPPASLAWNVALPGASGLVEADASRRASSTDHPSDLPTLLAVITAAMVLMSIGLMVSRRRWRRSTADPESSEGGGESV
jgi:hypothetical protein